MGVPNVSGLDRTAIYNFRGVSAALSHLGVWFATRRQAAKITRELASFEDRDLADMGLTRGDIPAVARGELHRY